MNTYKVQNQHQNTFNKEMLSFFSLFKSQLNFFLKQNQIEKVQATKKVNKILSFNFKFWSCPLLLVALLGNWLKQSRNGFFVAKPIQRTTPNTSDCSKKKRSVLKAYNDRDLICLLSPIRKLFSSSYSALITIKIHFSLRTAPKRCENDSLETMKMTVLMQIFRSRRPFLKRRKS